ncbi:MAG: endo alpha-1,4 polygalactosaminidase [bacterium]
MLCKKTMLTLWLAALILCGCHQPKKSTITSSQTSTSTQTSQTTTSTTTTSKEASTSEASTKKKEPKSQDFALLTGMTINEDTVLKQHYKILIIKPGKISKKALKNLHQYADQIYAYVNVGTLKSSSKTYAKYRRYKIGTYSKKKKTYIMNVGTKNWRKYIVSDVSLPLIKKGFDGLYLDHFDIYKKKKTKKIYNGLTKILKSFHKKDIPVILNNAGAFSEKYCQTLEDKQADNKQNKNASKSTGEEAPSAPLIYGICQKQVFTTYDEKTKETKKQKTEISTAYKDLLIRLKAQKINIYIVEYTKNTDWKSVIQAYCKSHKFSYYLAKNKQHSKE